MFLNIVEEYTDVTACMNKIKLSLIKTNEMHIIDYHDRRLTYSIYQKFGMY